MELFLLWGASPYERSPKGGANSAEERYEDLVRSAADSEYQKELMRKYQII